MLTAQCKRLANRSIVIGRTAFTFDGEGICKHPDVGNARYDFDVLLKKNGVSAVGEQQTSTAANPLKRVPSPQRSAVSLTSIKAEHEELQKASAPPVMPPTRNLPPVASTNTVRAEAVPGEASDNFLEEPVVNSDDDTSPGVPSAKKTTKSGDDEKKSKRRRVTKRKKKSDD